MENTNTAGSRFLMLLKKYIVENNRRILLSFGALFAVLALCGFLGGVISAGGNIQLGQFLYPLLMSTLGMVGASVMFSEMKSKQGRTSLLMEPANAIEKFIVRWLVWVVASMLLFWPAFEVAELMRRLGTALVHGNFIPMSSAGIRHMDLDMGECCLLLVCGYLCTQSFFVLGAILWPRLSFIKTIIATWVLQSVAMVAFVAGLNIAEDMLENINMLKFSSEINDNFIFYTIIVASVLTTLVNWTLTWMRLRESDNI